MYMYIHVHEVINTWFILYMYIQEVMNKWFSIYPSPHVHVNVYVHVLVHEVMNKWSSINTLHDVIRDMYMKSWTNLSIINLSPHVCGYTWSHAWFTYQIFTCWTIKMKYALSFPKGSALLWKDSRATGSSYDPKRFQFIRCFLSLHVHVHKHIVHNIY